VNRMTHCLLSLISLAVAASPGLAAEPAAGDVPHRIAASFQDLGKNVSPALTWKPMSLPEQQAWQHKVHGVLTDLLGRMPEPVPLDVKWVEEKSFEKFTRHKIYIQTESEYWAPVYYFVPHGIAKSVPAIVCLHGHSGINPYIREGQTEADRKKTAEHELDYAPFLAEHGYVTAALVVRGWNETSGFQDSGVKLPRSCTHVTMDSFLIGMTPQGLRCWDASRVIDFLQSRQEVDADRIGVAGLSGGGTLAMYFPVLDDRVKLAMIAGAFSSYRTSIYSIQHCVCNCLPGVMQHVDMSDVVASYAPRPVLLINGVNDPIFPIAQAQEGFAKLQQVYKVAGKPDNIEADFFDGGHAWSNRKSLQFLEEHFGPGAAPSMK